MRRFFLFLLLFVAVQQADSQTCPANLDFEDGDLSHWQCSIGFVAVDANGKNAITLQDTTPLPGRHELVSASADGTVPMDPYGKFPIVCPYGGKYSVKLGNTNTGSEAEGMSYTFTVPTTEDTFSFTYFYAVVFEDPGHTLPEQPRFFVTAYEVATGNIINCASYDYVSSSGLPGFLPSDSSKSVLYKEWSPSSIQFVNLGGKQVRLEFRTADCTLGGHFGYAYFDVGSGCSNILATAPYCVETNSLLLNAPYGFQYYTWYNEDFSKVMGNDQNLKLNPPPVTAGRFFVDLNPYPGYGCRDTVYADVFPLPIPPLPEAKTDYFYCQNDQATILTATPAPNSSLLWYTDTTQKALPRAPVPPTAVSGTSHFYVSQKTLFGCEGFHIPVTVRIDPVPNVSFSIDHYKECLTGNQFTFTSTSTNLQDSAFIWMFGDNSVDSGTAVMQHSYGQGNDYRITLRVRNGPVCYQELSNNIRVVPKPLADFSFPPVICQNQTGIVLTDISSVPQNLSSLTSWHWELDGNKVTGQNPVPVVTTTGGDVPASLVVATQEGCLSDTTRHLIRVHYQPKALPAWDATPLCNNKIINFTDRSSLPPGAAGEAITGWAWKFNTQTSAAQNPALLLSDGVYQIGLTVQSNFGCNSLPLDSFFTVNPKPVIGVAINDSCIRRSIYYTTQDLAQNVTTWSWDFGNGVHAGPATYAKKFWSSGDYSFTLYGKTVYGCMDTLYRPFLIYENKAFAGKDTLAAYDQPVQLNAHGGTDNHYTWTPSPGLSDDTLENPLATSRTDMIYNLDALTNEGCDAHSKIVIKRWNGPDIFIPTAFTPNGDNVNDLLHAKPVGMWKLDYFAVYDRDGKRVFYTKDFSQGWDGRVDGEKPQAGTYVAYAKAVDYTGKEVMKKVSVVLIK